ncbi:MAG: 50S ribosomal protein L21, partial [Spirochaetes bacterium RBG_13_68_11]
MYALVEIKGKQYKVEQGSVLTIDRVAEEKGSRLEFPSVLMVSDGASVKIGTPYLQGASVSVVVEDHVRAKKVLIGKFKKRKNYHRKQGHR